MTDVKAERSSILVHEVQVGSELVRRSAEKRKFKLHLNLRDEAKFIKGVKRDKGRTQITKLFFSSILTVSHSTSLILMMTVNQAFLIGRPESITAH